MAACASGDAARIVLASRPKMSERLEVRIVQKVRQGRLAVDECTLATAYPFETECVCQPWIAQVVAGCTGEATGARTFRRRRAPPRAAGGIGRGGFRARIVRHGFGRISGDSRVSAAWAAGTGVIQSNMRYTTLGRQANLAVRRPKPVRLAGICAARHRARQIICAPGAVLI